MKTAFKLVTLLLTVHLVACAPPDDEAKLRETLEKLCDAVEQRSVREVQNYLSDDFKTVKHSNNRQFKAFMLFHFRQNQVINIFTSDVQVSMHEETADLTFNTLLTGSSNWLPERGRRFKVETRWLKLEGEWKVSRVNWQSLDS